MEKSIFHSLSSLCYSKFSNPPSGGVRVHFIVGSNGPGYMVVLGTKGVHKYSVKRVASEVVVVHPVQGQVSGGCLHYLSVPMSDEWWQA